MTFKKGNTDGFAKGAENPNRTSQGTRKKRRVRSELRKIVNRLNEDLDKAFENLKLSLEGKEVDKEVLATSKWWVDKVVSTTNAAISEESKKVQIRRQLDDGSEEVLEMEEEEESKPKGAIFSLVVPNAPKKNEE